MARLLAIENVSTKLRNTLLQSLRPTDEAILLPGASQSVESSVFKNIVFRLAGNEEGLNASIFPRDLFTGISIVKLQSHDAAKVETSLIDVGKRRVMLEKLKCAVKSEMASTDLEVGPQLNCDDCDRDVNEWTCGLDGPSSFVGIYSAETSRSPDPSRPGMSRVHRELFLVCRAGAGVSASTFHSRLLSSLRADPTASLDSLLETEAKAPGSQALRRLTTASSRNRSRIIADVSVALGLSIPTIGDAAAKNKYRGAVVDIDVAVNTLRKLDECASSCWQLTNGVDASISKGLVTLSNPAEGVVMFLDKTGGHKTALRNECWSVIPFTTHRLHSGKQMSELVTNAYKGSPSNAHMDSDWIKSRFTWTNRQFGGSGEPNIEPFGLFGSHAPESFVQSFARELGLAELQAIKMRPELVTIAGVDSGKLRGIIKSL
ncbi:hypothetical protein N9S30_00165 [bacterium]|nr:hypothetical protein [bacterium]